MTDYLPAVLAHIAGFREAATTGCLWNEIVVGRAFGGDPRKDMPPDAATFDRCVKQLAIQGKIEAEMHGRAELWRVAKPKQVADRRLFA